MICGEPCTVKRNIQIKDNELEEVKQMKYLGIIFNSQLDSNDHIKARNKINLSSAYSLYNTGLIDKVMDTSTKSFIYKTYCRTSLLYGLDLADVYKKNYKFLRQDESMLLKRIIGVQKQASTTKTYQSLNIQELIYIVTNMKLWIRLEKNQYSGTLIE